jgi:hypothetical protein
LNIRLKICCTLAIVALLYGSKYLTLQKEDNSRITQAEIKVLSITAEHTLFDYKITPGELKQFKPGLGGTTITIIDCAMLV